MATAGYAVLDPARTTVTVSLAGHLPPVLLDQEGRPRLLDVPTDLPLGAYPGARRRATALPVPHAMLLYTDGLVERRGRSLDEGIGQLLATLSLATADELCTQAAAAMHHVPATDDIALIAIRLRALAQLRPAA
jgi:phosphoserine phosphatase RsbU/P